MGIQIKVKQIFNENIYTITKLPDFQLVIYSEKKKQQFSPMISKDRDEVFCKKAQFSFILETIAKQVCSWFVRFFCLAFANTMCALSEIKKEESVRLLPSKILLFPFALVVRKIRTNSIFYIILPHNYLFSFIYIFFIFVIHIKSVWKDW